MSQHPLYDQNGLHVAWLYDEYILTPEMRYVAYTSDYQVYTFSGVHRGYMDDGSFYDHEGRPVCFLHGSVPVARSPLAPLPSLPPLPPLPNLPPLPMMPALPPLAANWSNLNWLDFFEGKDA